MDKIRIAGLKVFAHHGLFPEETEQGQDFFVNVTLYTDILKAGITDDLTYSIDYGAVSHFITNYMQEHTYKLIESVAEQMSRALLIEFPLLEKVDLEIQKPHAPIGLPFETVSVQVTREWHSLIMSFGSNIGESRRLIGEGLKQLEDCPQIKGLRVSDIIETEPYGVTDQPIFLNGCAEFQTLLSPEEVLELFHKIEAEAGRERILRWGPRTLDFDIIFYDDLIMRTDDLIIPHVDMQNRQFVLEPLVGLCPDRVHPILGKTVAELWSELNGRNV